MEETPYESPLLKWYGSVTPVNIPEDFKQIRAFFEQAVAEEVMSEFDNDKHEEKHDHYNQR